MWMSYGRRDSFNEYDIHPESQSLETTRIQLSHVCAWEPPKNGEIALLPSTNGAIPYFLVLPGSELSISETTEYKYFSPFKPSREFAYKKWVKYCTTGYFIEPILVLWKLIFALYYTRLRPQCDLSTLGRTLTRYFDRIQYMQYWVATVSSLDKIICLFCRALLQKNSKRDS